MKNNGKHLGLNEVLIDINTDFKKKPAYRVRNPEAFYYLFSPETPKHSKTIYIFIPETFQTPKF